MTNNSDLRKIVYGQPDAIEYCDLKDLIAPDPSLGRYYPHNRKKA